MSNEKLFDKTAEFQEHVAPALAELLQRATEHGIPMAVIGGVAVEQVADGVTRSGLCAKGTPAIKEYHHTESALALAVAQLSGDALQILQPIILELLKADEKAVKLDD